MSGSLIPVSDEQAKLLQELLKTLRGAGSFIEKALGSTPEDLVGYLGGDWLRVRRAENLVKYFLKTMQRLDDWGIKEPIHAPLSVALPILQGAADEDREELADLWARLLANAMNPNLGNVRYSFIEAVRQMDPPDAVLLLHIYEENLAAIRIGAQHLQNKTIGHTIIAPKIRRTSDEVELSLRHLERLRFLDAISNNPGWYVNVTLREFMRACYPEITLL